MAGDRVRVQHSLCMWTLLNVLMGKARRRERMNTLSGSSKCHWWFLITCSVPPLCCGLMWTFRGLLCRDQIVVTELFQMSVYCKAYGALLWIIWSELPYNRSHGTSGSPGMTMPSVCPSALIQTPWFGTEFMAPHIFCITLLKWYINYSKWWICTFKRNHTTINLLICRYFLTSDLQWRLSGDR